MEIERGNIALKVYLTNRQSMFSTKATTETSFKNENVFVGKAHLAGKVDRLEIDSKHKTITVVDYKTGKSYQRWQSDPKLHSYRRQLYCYKILVEKSRSYVGYTVTGGRLEFIEPDKNHQINSLDLEFNQGELTHNTELLKVVWQHVKDLQFPDVSLYNPTLSDIRQFEQDLIEGKI